MEEEKLASLERLVGRYGVESASYILSNANFTPERKNELEALHILEKGRPNLTLLNSFG